jgi:hypothetical protein
MLRAVLWGRWSRGAVHIGRMKMGGRRRAMSMVMIFPVVTSEGRTVGTEWRNLSDGGDKWLRQRCSVA